MPTFSAKRPGNELKSSIRTPENRTGKSIWTLPTDKIRLSFRTLPPSSCLLRPKSHARKIPFGRQEERRKASPHYILSDVDFARILHFSPTATTRTKNAAMHIRNCQIDKVDIPLHAFTKRPTSPWFSILFCNFALITVKSEKYGKIHQSLYRRRF